MAKAGDKSELALVRKVLARELETINEYEAYAAFATSQRIRDFFLHLAKEEKEHVAEAMALIHEMDEEQQQKWEKTDVRHEHFAGAPKGGAEREASAPGAAKPAQDKRKARLLARLTVGSLKGIPQS